LLHAPVAKEHQRDGWVGPIASLNMVEKKISLLPTNKPWCPIGPAHGLVTVQS